MATPLYKITYRYESEIKTVFIKDEGKNITGSIKYRPAKHIIDSAYKLHLLDKSTPIIEVTSGNMGIALSYVAREKGNPAIIYMPSTMSNERKTMIRELGAKLVLTKNFEEAFELADACKGYHVHQFANPLNAESYTVFAQELETKLNEFPAFLAGVGTSGTLTGTITYLRKKYPNCKAIAVEPAESLILSTGVNHGEHEIQGLSDGLVPDLYKRDLVNQVISIKSVDAIRMSQVLIKKFNLDIGISSGANFLGAVLSKVDKLVTVFPDRSDRYHSTRLFDTSIKSDLVDKVELIKLEVI